MCILGSNELMIKLAVKSVHTRSLTIQNTSDWASRSSRAAIVIDEEKKRWNRLLPALDLNAALQLLKLSSKIP